MTNEQRRENYKYRYANDPVFREKLKAYQRARYNEKRVPHTNYRKPCMAVTADEYEATLGVYDSMTEAAKDLDILVYSISKAYNHGHKVRCYKFGKKMWLHILPYMEDEDDGGNGNDGWCTDRLGDRTNDDPVNDGRAVS